METLDHPFCEWTVNRHARKRDDCVGFFDSVGFG